MNYGSIMNPGSLRGVIWMKNKIKQKNEREKSLVLSRSFTSHHKTESF